MLQTGTACLRLSHMKTARTTKPTLESILVSRYGTTLLEAPAIAIEWAASHLATLTDNWTAGQAWRKADTKRHRMGVYTTFPSWDNPLYDAYTSKTEEGYKMATERRARVSAGVSAMI